MNHAEKWYTTSTHVYNYYNFMLQEEGWKLKKKKKIKLIITTRLINRMCPVHTHTPSILTKTGSSPLAALPLLLYHLSKLADDPSRQNKPYPFRQPTDTIWFTLLLLSLCLGVHMQSRMLGIQPVARWDTNLRPKVHHVPLLVACACAGAWAGGTD